MSAINVPLLIYSHAVPAPLVIIEEIGSPFNGSEFTISCIVKVNKSVDADINIFTHWLLPMRQNDRETMFNISERVTKLEGLHNFTFKPLRSQDSGQYVCNATITPQNRDSYVAENTTENSYNLTVQSEKKEYIESLLILCLNQQSYHYQIFLSLLALLLVWEVRNVWDYS